MSLSLPDYTQTRLEVKDEFITIEVELTCVGILTGSNWNLFWMFFVLRFFLYDYNYEIVVFDGPIDVLMRIG